MGLSYFYVKDKGWQNLNEATQSFKAALQYVKNIGIRNTVFKTVKANSVVLVIEV